MYIFTKLKSKECIIISNGGLGGFNGVTTTAAWKLLTKCPRQIVQGPPNQWRCDVEIIHHWNRDMQQNSCRPPSSPPSLLPSSSKTNFMFSDLGFVVRDLNEDKEKEHVILVVFGGEERGNYGLWQSYILFDFFVVKI